MFTKKIHKHIEYLIATRNSKVFINSKTDHLKHYDENIVKMQNEVGLENYDGNSICLTHAIDLDINFDTLMKKRKSERDFGNYEISLAEISTLLYYTGGYKKDGKGGKHTPSSGGFNSVEIFVIVLSSKEVNPGIYYFNPQKNCLNEIYLGDYKEWLATDVFYQKEWSNSSVVFILTSDITRLSKKYLLRSYKLSLMDIGHVSQNFYLTATAMNLKVCASGGYIESEIENAIDINGIDVASSLTIIVGK